MPFNKKTVILIKNLYPVKAYFTQMLLKEFPSKNWNERSVQRLLTENLRHRFSWHAFTRRQRAADHELRLYTAEHVILSATSCSVRKVRYKHISQYLKFQEILKLVRRRLVASCTIFSEPPTQRKTTCLFALLIDVFSGSAATQLRWGGKFFINAFRSYDFSMLCARNYEDRLKLLQVIGENPADTFLDTHGRNKTIIIISL